MSAENAKSVTIRGFSQTVKKLEGLSESDVAELRKMGEKSAVILQLSSRLVGAHLGKRDDEVKRLLRELDKIEKPPETQPRQRGGVTQATHLPSEVVRHLRDTDYSTLSAFRTDWGTSAQTLYEEPFGALRVFEGDF